MIKQGISITNFSNSWTDGIAFCSLLHSYLPDRIDLEIIKKESKVNKKKYIFNSYYYHFIFFRKNDLRLLLMLLVVLELYQYW
jgi:hypothetical protein